MGIWKDGDTASASKSVTLELDAFKDENWHVFCVNNLTETLSAIVESWQDFCSNGFQSVVKKIIILALALKGA